MSKKVNSLSNFDLVGDVYDAALDPDRWPVFIEKFSKSVKADMGVVSFHNIKEKKLPFVKTFERDESLFNKYRDHFININPYLDIIDEIPHTVYASNRIYDVNVLEKTEFYNDWLKPQNIYYHAGAIIFNDEARLGLLDMQRKNTSGPFDDDALEQIKLFEPHLRRALTINQKFWDLLAAPEAAMAVLDNLEIGVIFLDELGRPVYLNPKAEKLTKFGDGVVVRPDGLSAEYPEQARELQQLIHESIQTGLGKGLNPGGVARIGILSDAPHHVLVSPLSTRRNDLGLTTTRICAAVFISSPTKPYGFSVESLRNLFGLTPMEARLVGELVNGYSLRDIADKFEISKNTARDQLSSVFSKTGVRRQVDLINLVRSTPFSIISEGVLLGSPLGGGMDRRKSDDRRRTSRDNAS